MAYYAALVSFLDVMNKTINSSQHHPFSNFDRENHQIHVLLYEKFLLLHNLLEDLDDILERRIRDASYQAQDIVESHISDRIPRQLLVEGSEEPTLDNIKETEYHEELQKVMEEVDSIVEELKRMKVESRTTHEDKYVATIKTKLCVKSSKREVVSIVGTGGTGKTTLARKVFGDKLIHEYFDCRAWVNVSRDYHLRKILLSIGNSLSIIDEKLSREGVDVLKKAIYQHLFGSRYFIIMDDMWDTNFWDDVKWIFPNDCSESRIIITTRESNVASHVSSSDFIHEMQFFSEEQSWNLFSEKVFCPPELEDIGRSIAIICGGLPLSIVVVAGLLSKVNKAKPDWEEIAEDLRSAAIENHDNLSNILSLSYDCLPHHLKPCFLYLGGFPEDEEIPISKLIKLWVAEGVLKPVQDKDLEELGEQYLEDLASRNLVLLSSEKRSNGKSKFCSMHDVLREFCIRTACDEKFIGLHESDTIGNVRRLYIPPGSNFPDRDEENVPHVSSFSHVRSVLFFGNSWDDIESYLPDFKLLRVLDALSMELDVFPDQIVELFHLRYLALQCTECHIPPSISKLQNLQTLIMPGTTSLPSEIWRMSQLRHVIITRMTLPPIPLGESLIIDGVLLGMLQTLSTVIDFTFTRDIVATIRSLKKLIVIIKVHEPGENWKKFGLDNLVRLRKLETLGINFNVLLSELDDVIRLPESFAFPLNLRKLTLEGCRIPWKDMTAVGSLPNLQILKLRWNSFVGEEWKPNEEQFPQLKFLLMESLYDLKYWRAKNTHFPFLEQLQIKLCSELEEIPYEIGDSSTLQLIEVHYCSKASKSALKIQKEKRERGNGVLQVRVYG